MQENNNYARYFKKIQNNHVELRFNRPELRNAISRDLLNEFQSALLELKSREEIRSLVLTGEGDRAFVPVPT